MRLFPLVAVLALASLAVGCAATVTTTEGETVQLTGMPALIYNLGAGGEVAVEAAPMLPQPVGGVVGIGGLVALAIAEVLRRKVKHSPEGKHLGPLRAPTPSA